MHASRRCHSITITSGVQPVNASAQFLPAIYLKDIGKRFIILTPEVPVTDRYPQQLTQQQLIGTGMN